MLGALVAMLLWSTSAVAQQTGTFPTSPSGASSSVSANQGTAASTSDGNAWPFKIVFGGSQIDPRDISDRVGRALGQVTFSSPQAVTQSGSWTFSVSNFPTTATTAAIAVRCVNTAGNAFESCAGAGGSVGSAVDIASIGGNPVTTELPVSLASVPSHAVTNAGTFAVQVTSAPTTAVTGPLTDTQLRATPVPISGSIANTAFIANAGTNLNTSALALDATLTGRTQKSQITDGTRDGTVKAASTAAAAADTSVVVALSPNSPTPTGANTIGAVTQASGPWTVNQTQMNGVTLSSSAGVSDTGTQRVTLAQEFTYAASTIAKTATAAGTGVFFEICGSASKTIRLQRFIVSGTVATAAVWGDVILSKRSAASTGGTSTGLTATPYDTGNATAGSATVKYYTVLGTGGALVGTLYSATQLFPVTAISATLQPTPAPLLWTWRDTDAEAPTLRGTGQCVTAHFGTTTTNAPTLNVSVAWTEK